MMQPAPTPHEVATMGELIYQQRIWPQVHSKYCGQYLVLDVVSGDYEVDADHRAASDRALARHPNGKFYSVRVGDTALGRVGLQMVPH